MNQIIALICFSANDINQHPCHTLISESKNITHVSVFQVIIKYPTHILILEILLIK
jgi:hypothetical protein